MNSTDIELYEENHHHISLLLKYGPFGVKIDDDKLIACSLSEKTHNLVHFVWNVFRKKEDLHLKKVLELAERNVKRIDDFLKGIEDRGPTFDAYVKTVATIRKWNQQFSKTQLSQCQRLLSWAAFSLGMDWRRYAYQEQLKIQEVEKIPASIYQFYDSEFSWYYLNENRLPLVISPKAGSKTDLFSFKSWLSQNKEKLKNLLSEECAILLRGFPIGSEEDFKSILNESLGIGLIDYIGEGSRTKISDGVYTSTEAPPQFQIPLHHELSCTDSPPDIIGFYCANPPESGTGQTLLGRTEDVTKSLKEKEAWYLFKDRTLKYVSRHPPRGSFYSKCNVTHKTWQDSFEVEDRDKVKEICDTRNFRFKWNKDWLKVIRLVPPMKDIELATHWYNQAHLYHSNPRIRGGWVNHILANLLYIIPSTRQYDIKFQGKGSIPQKIIYEIYDALEKNTAKFSWEKGDLLLIDNKKGLHGRASYENKDPSNPRKILTAMGNK